MPRDRWECFVCLWESVQQRREQATLSEYRSAFRLSIWILHTVHEWYEWRRWYKCEWEAYIRYALHKENKFAHASTCIYYAHIIQGIRENRRANKHFLSIANKRASVVLKCNGSRATAITAALNWCGMKSALTPTNTVGLSPGSTLRNAKATRRVTCSKYGSFRQMTDQNLRSHMELPQKAQCLVLHSCS